MIEDDTIRGTSRVGPAIPRAACPTSSLSSFRLHKIEECFDSFRGGCLAMIMFFDLADKSMPLLAASQFRSGLVTNASTASLAGSDRQCMLCCEKKCKT